MYVCIYECAYVNVRRARCRFEVPDTLMMTAHIVRIENVLLRVAEVLARAYEYYSMATETGWRPLESALFCVRGLAEAVPPTEAVVVPGVIALVLQLPAHPEILYDAETPVTHDMFGVYACAVTHAPAHMCGVYACVHVCLLSCWGM